MNGGNFSRRLVGMLTLAATLACLLVPANLTAEDKDDACDHQNNDYDRNRKEYSHPTSPFSGYPETYPDFTFARCLGTTRAGGSPTVHACSGRVCPCGFVRVV